MAMGITSGGNVCALLVRTITFLLLLYAIVLSTMTISSCHFLSAISPDNTPHGVGLTSFEMENGNCLSHTSFITSNYNGMELTAKIGGYLAPLFGVLTILFIVLECCKGDEWFCAGKCLPCLQLLLSVICQGLTFMLFNSTLFCSQTTEIDRCIMDEAAYRSVQATTCYFLCFILYLCGRTPKPLCLGLGSRNKARRGSERGGGGGGKKSGKKKKGEFTKEDYEQRRKEKKIKSRGVSGRSKQQILQDINGGGGEEKKKKSRRLSSSGSSRKKSSYSSRKEDSYSPSRRGGGGANDSQPTYDDYVDTEPDGMDWSAYDPKEREEYYDRKRSRERQRREQERERDRDGDGDYYDEEEQLYRRRNEDDYSEYTDDRDRRDRDRGGRDDDYGSRYSEQSGSRYSGSGYVGTVYDESGRSLYSRGERGGYDDEESYRSGRPPRDDRYADEDYKDDEYTRGEDSFMSDGQSYDDRGLGRGDDGYHDDRHNDSYYSEEDHRSRRSNSRRNDGYDEASYDASYDDGYGRRRGDDDYYDDRPLD